LEGVGVFLRSPPLFFWLKNEYVFVPKGDERASNRRRLIAEDAAKRPWLIGKALRDFRYTWWSRVTLVFRETLDSALWPWRMSR